jgi:flavin reductase (DIM6/NTAB) family NADH-FMN oxidoreductase RutF
LKKEEIMKIVPGELTKMEAHELMMSAIVPRPIAFVSTIGENGIFNLAPYSSFSSAGVKPAFVSFHVGLKRDGRKKDTLVNIQFSKEFVINVVTENLAEAMNRTAAEFPPDVDEFKEAGLTAVPGDLVRAPRVAESPVSMECKLFQILELPPSPEAGHLIIGQVVLVHASDELWTGKDIDITRLKSVGRLGGQLYCRVNDIFEMKRP